MGRWILKLRYLLWPEGMSFSEYFRRLFWGSIYIASPRRNRTFAQGTNILFEVRRLFIPFGKKDTFRWSSDLDENFGDRSRFTYSGLSEGTHRITVQYTKGTGKSAKVLTARTTLTIGDCSVDETYDVDTHGVPKFASHHNIAPASIEKISKFRSGMGHDYSDDFEDCRSMKHYFKPHGDGSDWDTIEVKSPITGEIESANPEGSGGGYKINIRSTEYRAFLFSIFHVNPARSFEVGDEIEAGDVLGTHISGRTYSDISVFVRLPDCRLKYLSYFDVMTDELFRTYADFGLTSRNQVIISREHRNANPFTCTGSRDERFSHGDHGVGDSDWFVFSSPSDA